MQLAPDLPDTITYRAMNRTNGREIARGPTSIQIYFWGPWAQETRSRGVASLIKLAPPPKKKNRKKYFSGNYHVKFGHFSGKYHVKFGHFSGK